MEIIYSLVVDCHQVVSEEDDFEWIDFFYRNVKYVLFGEVVKDKDILVCLNSETTATVVESDKMRLHYMSDWFDIGKWLV